PSIARSFRALTSIASVTQGFAMAGIGGAVGPKTKAHTALCKLCALPRRRTLYTLLSTLYTLAFSPSQPWVCDRIRRIRQQIDRHIRYTYSQDAPLHQWIVAVRNRRERHPPQSRPTE